MRLRLTSRVLKLENKFAGPKDHIRMAEDEEEVKAIQAWWDSSPYSKMPGHKLWIITDNMPKKDPNL